MKTRADIYGHEAAELLRIISMYPGLTEKQLCRFFHGREDVIRNLLSHLARQRRISRADTGGHFPYGNDKKEADPGMMRAVWVLLDFIDKVEYHSSGEFPVEIVFFSGGELYEVVHAATGQEALVTHVLSRAPFGRRIVLVDAPGQIPLLEIPGTTGFCTVDVDGNVSYYKKSTLLLYASTPVSKTEYLVEAGEAHGIEVGYEDGVLEVSLPRLLPKKKTRQSGLFLLDPLHATLGQYAKEHPLPHFRECVVCISHVYDHGLPDWRIPDYDNLQQKQLLDTIALYVMADDSGLLCDAYNTTEHGDRDGTRVYVMEKSRFAGWLSGREKELKSISDF